MSCPECGSLTANIEGTTVTLMSGHSFRDEQGRNHHHDPNMRTTHLTCRGCGRRYVEQSKPRCWCEKNLVEEAR